MRTEPVPELSQMAGTPDPVVAILIPCWGCERFITEAIRSALAQTYSAIEVVVVEESELLVIPKE